VQGRIIDPTPVDGAEANGGGGAGLEGSLLLWRLIFSLDPGCKAALDPADVLT
jgi:hypothetical protein